MFVADAGGGNIYKFTTNGVQSTYASGLSQPYALAFGTATGQISGAPTLNIAYANNQAIISWPSSATGWTLQTNSNLATGTWANYGGIVGDDGMIRLRGCIGSARAFTKSADSTDALSSFWAHWDRASSR